MKNLLVTLQLIFYAAFLAAQPSTAKPKIQVAPSGSAEYVFTAIDPVINCGEDKEESFRYFWEFGDGNYTQTTKKTVTHRYLESKVYDVRLFVTPRYCAKGLGYPSEVFKHQVAEGRVGFIRKPPFASRKPEDTNPNNFYINVNHNARLNEPLVAFLSFQNANTQAEGGRVFFFYDKDRISLADSPTASIRDQHLPTGVRFGESGISEFANSNPSIAALSEANSGKWMWRYGNLAANDYQNIFLTMIPKVPYNKETEFISLKGAMLTDSGVYEEFELLVEVIDAHDPNKIVADKRLVNYRRITSRQFGYTLHFQNEGDASAINVEAEATIPKGLSAEREDILVKSFHPNCGNCFSWEVLGNKVRFKFTDINLPGEKQDGIKDKKKTQGFVKYAFKPKKKIKKSVVKSKGTIYFDGKPLNIKRPAKSWFKQGHSFGIKVGVNDIPKDNDYDLFAGLTYSPFKPHGIYWQPEVMINFNRLTTPAVYEVPSNTQFTTLTDSANLFVFGELISTKSIKNFIDLVPLSINYDLTDFLGVGLGVQGTFEIREHSCKNVYQVIETSDNINYPTDSTFEVDVDCTSDTINDNGPIYGNPIKSKKFTPSIYGDIRLGSVRSGPTLGARFLYRFIESDGFQDLNFADKSNLQLYLLVKF